MAKTGVFEGDRGKASELKKELQRAVKAISGGEDDVNSTLESVWNGILIWAWPLYAEQQLNAFELVKELGMVVDIKIDFRTDIHRNSLSFVSADEIETGIRKMMAMEGEEIEATRKMVAEMKEKSRAAVVEGGSSYTAIGALVNDITNNIPKDQLGNWGCGGCRRRH